MSLCLHSVTVSVFCLLYNAPAVKLLASGPLKHKEPVGGLLLFAFTHTPSIPVNMVVNGFQSAAAFCRGCVWSLSFEVHQRRFFYREQ